MTVRTTHTGAAAMGAMRGVPAPVPMTGTIEERLDKIIEAEIAIDDDAQLPETRERFRELLTQLDMAESAIAHNAGQRMRIDIKVSSTVVTLLSESEIESLFENAIQTRFIDELMQAEGSEQPLRDVVESMNADEECPRPVMAEFLLEKNLPAIIVANDEWGSISSVEVVTTVVSDPRSQLAELEQVVDSAARIERERAELIARRNTLIQELTRGGVGSTTVARSAGMSTTSVFKIIGKRSKGGK